MSFEFQIRSVLSLSIWIVLSSHSAWAEEHPLKLKAETSLTFINHLPAVSDNSADQISTNTLGLNFSTSLGLQKIDITFSVADARYQNFSFFNYTAYNYNAGLKWSLTPQLHGILSSEQKETTDNLPHTQNQGQGNLQTENTIRFDAIYEIDGPWQVLTGISQFSQNNQQTPEAGGDYTSHTISVGLGYVFASGSNMFFRQKKVNGQYSNQSSTSLYDSIFEQTISDLRAHWAMPDKSSADFYLSSIKQSHTNSPQRNFSGINHGASINWLLTGKSSVELGQARVIAGSSANNSNYTQKDSLYFLPRWQPSAKSLVIFRNEWARIAYLGSPTGTISNLSNDTTRDTSLSFYWQPDQRLTFSAALQNASRASNQTGLDYNSNQISVSAQYSY